MDEKPRRRWLQFSVRTLLVAMTVIAAVLAYHVKWMHDRQELLASGTVIDGSNYQLEQRCAPGLLWLMGEPGVNHLIILEGSTIEHAESLFPEAEVSQLGQSTSPPYSS